MTDIGPDLATDARRALECVCSGSGREPASRFYSADFIDHVNDFELRGLEGVRRSVELYTSVLSNIEITVEEQLVDGNRVTSRFVVAGTNRGRRVRFNGITISPFDTGRVGAGLVVGVVIANQVTVPVRYACASHDLSLSPARQSAERSSSGGSARESNPPIHRSREDSPALKTEAVTRSTRASAAEPSIS